MELIGKDLGTKLGHINVLDKERGDKYQKALVFLQDKLNDLKEGIRYGTEDGAAVRMEKNRIR